MKQGTIRIDRLRQLVEKYHVGFRLVIDDVTQLDVDGGMVELAYRLDLHGDPDYTQRLVPCRSCVPVLRAIFDIADALTTVERQTLRDTNRHYERRMRYSRRNPRCEEVDVGFEVKIRLPLKQAPDGWGRDVLQQIRSILLALGCYDLKRSVWWPVRNDAREDLNPQVLKESDVAAAPVA